MMAFTRNNPFELLVDDHHGQYVGQIFAETVKREMFPSITAEEWSILETGPEHEHYSEVSCELDQHESTIGASLHWMDGALWAVDWSLIGEADDRDDYGAAALHKLQEDPALWALYCDLRAALYDGPGSGSWTESRLAELRDGVQSICEAIADSLPLYWSTDYGIEEISIDVESLLYEESPGLKEISSYW